MVQTRQQVIDRIKIIRLRKLELRTSADEYLDLVSEENALVAYHKQHHKRFIDEDITTGDKDA